MGGSSGVLVLLLLASCGGGARHTRAERPFAFVTPAGEVDEEARGVHHPPANPAVSGPVELEGVLGYADLHAPVLRVARSTRARAGAARAAASPLFPANPALSGGVGPRFGIQSTGVDVELSLSHQIWIAGERGTRLDAAERFAELTDAEIEQVRWSVHTDVHATFHQALVARERAALAERVVAFQLTVLGIAERRVGAGDTAPLSLRLAEAELAQARQQAVATAQEYRAARLRLALLSGWPASSPPEPAGALDEPRDPPAVGALLVFARRHLPALAAREAAIAEARARVEVAHRNAWPRPTLGASYRHEGNPTVEGPYEIVLGTLTVPIPSWQTNQGGRARAEADLEVAEAELDALSMQIEGQIAIARSEVVAAAERVRAYGTEILPRFEQNLALLGRAFELGEIDVLELSIGRERFLRIQSDALAAYLDYFVALASLERAVGVDLWHDAHGEEGP